MSPRTTGYTLIGFGVAATALRLARLSPPVFKIPFLAGNTVGYVLAALIVAIGVWLAIKGGAQWNVTPLTLKKLQRFRAIRRGYVSFLVVLLLIGVASLDSLLVGKRALIVHHEGKWHFPFMTEVIPGKTFGLGYDAETDYRDLQAKFRTENKGNWVLMPPVPYASALDSPAIIERLEERDGKVFRAGESKPFNGIAYTVFASNQEQKRQEFQYRNGLRHGDFRGWNDAGDQIEKGRYEAGKRADYTDFTNGKAAAFESQAFAELKRAVYPPSPPSMRHRHYLGTNSTGIDVLAMLFGGLQQAVIAAVLYIVCVFAVGVFIGGSLGYFGGKLDLLGQRLIEIWSVLPFLFVVMIISSLISPTLTVLVALLAAFGWMGSTSYLRTATYKERERDYVAAARLLGASTPRIIFHHVLPNVIAILVTLAPFEVAGVITSLAALDFLGFGLPPDEPSWGRLLHEGVDNFAYPWIVTSAFVAMAAVLMLVTFVGEAVREAFDPKKFTTYE